MCRVQNLRIVQEDNGFWSPPSHAGAGSDPGRRRRGSSSPGSGEDDKIQFEHQNRFENDEFLAQMQCSFLGSGPVRPPWLTDSGVGPAVSVEH